MWTNVFPSSPNNALAFKINFIATLILASELEFGETLENFSKVNGILYGKIDMFTIATANLSLFPHELFFMHFDGI